MLKRGFKKMLAEANATIETVSVQDLAYDLEENDALLVDVRETVERETDAGIPNSLHVPRGLLEFHADPESAIFIDALQLDRRIVLYCGTGGRSALAAKTLLEMGYHNVASLAGGFEAWRSSEGDID